MADVLIMFHLRRPGSTRCRTGTGRGAVAEMEELAGHRTRLHGEVGPLVIALHGGPAAIGNAGPLARGLAEGFRVLEPWQRRRAAEPLTVAGHVADLHDLITASCGGERPALVGESWGAMLALAYAAAHPQAVGPLALVGCGTFDPVSRAQLQATLAERTRTLQPQLDALADAVADPAERRTRERALLYDYAPLAVAPVQGRARSLSTWPATPRPGTIWCDCRPRASIRRPSPRSHRRS